MPSIITQGFRVANAFGAAVNFRAPYSSLYMSIGKSEPWGTEPTIPVPDNDLESLKDRFERMIAMKRVTDANVSMAIKRYNWFSGDTSYVAYDTSTEDLHTMKFYTYADGSVFKCITKGPGASTEMPTINNSIGTSTKPALSDGYVWKYMYTIDAQKAETFNTPGFIPVENVESNVWINSSGDNPLDVNGVVGHGANNAYELFAYYVIVNCKYNASEGGLINTTNSYREICLIIAPVLNSGGFATDLVYDMTTKIQFNTSSGSFSQNETVLINSKPAVVVEVGAGFIKVNSFEGSLSTSGNVVGPSGSGTYSSIAQSPLIKKYTGNILFAEQRMPITRAPDQVESLNIVLEF